MKKRNTVALLVILAVSGCGGVEEEGKPKQGKPTMNMQEAAERADNIVSSTMEAVKPPVEWAHHLFSDSACSDFKNDSTGTGSVTRRAAVITIVSGERRGSFLGIVERHWKKNGYKITNVRNHRDNPAIFAATPENFRMSLKVGFQGQVFLSVTTPCMAESEVAPPASKPGGQEYTGEEPPLPNKHSDFWSARTPVPSNGPAEG